MASRKSWKKIRERTVDLLFHAGRKSRIEFARETLQGLLDLATAREASLTLRIQQLNAGLQVEGNQIAVYDVLDNRKGVRNRIQELQQKINALDAEVQRFIATRNEKRQELMVALRGLRVRGHVRIMEVADLVALEQIKNMERRTAVAFALALNPRDLTAVDRIIDDLGLERLREGYLMMVRKGSYGEVQFKHHRRYKFKFIRREVGHEDGDEHENDEHED